MDWFIQIILVIGASAAKRLMLSKPFLSKTQTLSEQ
jgi:hypothetical protein